MESHPVTGTAIAVAPAAMRSMKPVAMDAMSRNALCLSTVEYAMLFAK